MKTREILRRILSAMNRTYMSLEEPLGLTRQTISQKTIRGTLKADEFFKIMNEIGVEVKFYRKDTGEEIVIHPKGRGAKAKRLIDGVYYNTLHSTPLSNSFFADGENEFNEVGEAEELYVDDEGRYFVVLYRKENPEKGIISLVSASMAAMFIEKYGVYQP